MNTYQKVTSVLHKDDEELLKSSKKVFLIEKQWWQQWQENPEDAPGPVDNKKLVQEITNKPRNDLEANQDFVYVSPQVWELVHEAYRGGPTVEIFILNSIPQFDTVTVQASFVSTNNEELRNPPSVFHVPEEITVSRLKKHLVNNLVISNRTELYQIIEIDFDSNVIDITYKPLEDRLHMTLQECDIKNMTRLFLKYEDQAYSSPDNSPPKLDAIAEFDFDDENIHDFSSFRNDGSSTDSTSRMNISDYYDNFAQNQADYVVAVQTRFDTEEVWERINGIFHGNDSYSLRIKPIEKIRASIALMYEDIKSNINIQ